MLLMLALAACPNNDSPPVDDTAPDDSAPDDTDPPTVEDPLLLSVELEQSETVATVARVRWETLEPSTGSVRFGTPGSLEHRTPTTPEGTTHEALLLGLRQETEVGFQVEATAGETTETSEEQLFVTGSLPDGLPDLTLSLAEAGASEGFTIVPLQGDTCWTTILDGDGQAVWASEITCLTHRTRLLPDGSGLISHSHRDPENPAILERVSFFGDEVVQIPVENAHHDFAIVDQDTYAALGYEVRTFDNEGEDYPLIGDTIIEIGPDGEQTVIWELFDHLDPNLSDWFPDSRPPDMGLPSGGGFGPLDGVAQA